MPLNTLDKELSAKWIAKKNTLITFIKEFGKDAIKLDVIKSRIPADLKYSQEYLDMFGDSTDSIFENLITNGGYEYRLTQIAEYIINNKDVGDELVFLIDDAVATLSKSESNPPDNNYAYSNVPYRASNICSYIEKFFIPEIIKKENPKMDYLLYILNSDLLVWAGKYDKSIFTKIANIAIINSANALEYIDIIKKKSEDYKNYPLILLNKNIDRDKRIAIIKKTFIQKNLNKYISFLRDADDFDMIDDFITAVVTQNNRVKEKDTATKDILERLLIGMSGERHYTFSPMIVKQKKNYDAFFNKYAACLSSSYLNSMYSDRWTDKNRNIKAYFGFLVNRESSYQAKLQKIAAAPKMSRYIFNDLLSDLKDRYNGLENVTDHNLIKSLIEADANFNKSAWDDDNSSGFNLFTWRVRHLFDASMSTIVNKFPDVFDEYLKSAHYRSQSARWSTYSVENDKQDFDFENFSVENMQKLRLFTKVEISSLFMESDSAKSNYLLKNMLQFAKYFYDFLATTACRVPANSESGELFYQYYLEPFMVEDSRDLQPCLNAILSKLNDSDYARYFTNGIILGKSGAASAVNDLLDKIERLGLIRLSNEDYAKLSNNIAYIRDSVLLLAGIE